MARLQSYNSINRFFSLNRADENFIRLFSSRITPEKSAKGKVMTQEQRTIAVKTYVQEYVQSHSGKLPPCSAVKKEVGGSWYVLRKIYSKVCHELKGPTLQHEVTKGATTIQQSPTETLAGEIQAQSGGETELQTASITKNQEFQLLAQQSKKESFADLTKDDVQPDPAGVKSAVSAVSSTGEKSINHKNSLIPSEENKKLPIKELPCTEKLEGMVVIKTLASAGERSEEQKSGSGKNHIKKSKKKHKKKEMKNLTKDAGTTPVTQEVSRSNIEDDSDIESLLSPSKNPRKTLKKSPILVNLSVSSVKLQNKIQESPGMFGKDNSSTNPGDIFQNNNSASRILQRIRQFGQDRRVPKYNFVAHEGTDDEKEDDYDFSALDYPDSGSSNDPVIPKSMLKFGNDMFHSKKARTVSANPTNVNQPVIPRAVLSLASQHNHEQENIDKSKSESKIQSLFSRKENIDTKISEKKTISEIQIKSGQYTSLQKEQSVENPAQEEKVRPIISTPELRSETKENQDRRDNARQIVVMFLKPKAAESDINRVFNDCGKINKIELFQSKLEHIRYSYAVLQFNTEEGYQKALLKKNVAICGGDVVVEAVNIDKDFSKPKISENIEQNPLSFSEIKISRCKVMIRNFPDTIKLNVLKKALSFCGNVASIFIDASNSVIIEFETEEARDKALKAAWISVDGRKVQISAIDIPRTPVVRIANVSSKTAEKTIWNFCESLGHVKKVIRRDSDLVDVHFSVKDLDSIPSILNSLNGVCMDQNHWQAQPATVFPPETLQILWKSLEGRLYLNNVMQHLFRIVNRASFDCEEISELATQCYGIGEQNINY